jgi:Helix-hairpin-helix motif
MGFFAPAGFAYAAYRARRRSWYAVGLAWGLVAFVGLAINIPAAEDSDADGFSSLLMMTAWVGGFVNALVIRGEYVRRASGAQRDPVMLARRRVKERRRAQELAREEPMVARELGVGRPDVAGAEWMGVVDVNHAAAEAIAEVTGVDGAVAERIVTARGEVRGFSSAEDLGHALDLDPAVVDALRERGVFLPG